MLDNIYYVYDQTSHWHRYPQKSNNLNTTLQKAFYPLSWLITGERRNTVIQNSIFLKFRRLKSFWPEYLLHQILQRPLRMLCIIIKYGNTASNGRSRRGGKKGKLCQPLDNYLHKYYMNIDDNPINLSKSNPIFLSLSITERWKCYVCMWLVCVDIWCMSNKVYQFLS